MLCTEHQQKIEFLLGITGGKMISSNQLTMPTSMHEWLMAAFLLLQLNDVSGDFSQQRIGCYKDGGGNNRVMGSQAVHKNMTLNMCIKHCSSKSYFGVEYYFECYCDEQYNRLGPANNCDKPCGGNGSQICGGDGALSVYWVCPEGSFGPLCTQSCHCLSNPSYGQHCFRNGTCPDGCQHGWTGTNGNCGTDIDECKENSKCSQLCNNTPGGYSCSCLSGYELNTDGRTCDDLDECSLQKYICGHGHQCINKPGSYTCSCRNGFVLNKDLRACDDIDECADNNTCTHRCMNTPGSFTCSCPSDLQLEGDHRTCSKGSSNAVVVVLILIGLLIAVVLCAVAILLFRRHRLSETRQSLSVLIVNKKKPRTETTKTDEDNFINNRHLAASSGANGKTLSSNCKETFDNDIDTSPIYANFVIDNKEVAKTGVKVTDLPELVARINKMPDLFQAEFRKIPLSSDAKCTFAENRELKSKNRFKNILPYDENRVTLSKIGNDPLTTYINASFIKGYSKDEKVIASHGPTMSTLDDFWRMIWEYNVGVIVMVTKCHEEGKTKCEQYWPEDSERDFGVIQVATQSVEERPHRIVRKLRASKVGEMPRLVTQVQFTDWPDHGVPEHAVSLLAMRHAVRRLVRRDQYIVVHCSAGVGRTGTYLAVDYLLSKATAEGFVDVCSHVTDLRDQRMHSVQTLDQYSFIFIALLEGLTLGETTSSVERFKEYVAKLGSINPVTKKTFIQTEFQMLQQMLPTPQPSDCADALSELNIHKNRNLDLPPLDSRRVFLRQQRKGETDYINAVYVPSFLRKNAFICTQLPLKETIGDFWNMCVDHKCKVIVFLCTSDHVQDMFSFLPADGCSLEFGSTFVGGMTKSKTRSNDAFELFTVSATRADVKQQENVYANTQENDVGYQVSVARVAIPTADTQLSSSLIKVHCLLSSLTIATASEQQPPVVVVSSDGVQHCGHFIAVSNLCDMINTQQEVDVFQTVYNVKRAQPHFFTNTVEYSNLYTMAVSCVNQTSMYSNT